MTITSNALRGRAGRALPVRTQSPAIKRSLARFHVGYRSRLARLAQRHARLADLAVTFPGLLFALAVPGRGVDPWPAADLVVRGAPLKTAAAKAGIPLWLRKLPPEAFDGPLTTLPDSELFRRRIGNHVPRLARQAAEWLGAVAEAARWGDDDFAVWIARELVHDRSAVRLQRLRLLALHAWYSRRSSTSAHRLMRKVWHPGVRFANALTAAEEWSAAMALHANLGDRVVDTWLQPGMLFGLEFVPLRSAASIAEEADAMGNCLRDYGAALVHNRQRLWSIRRSGERVATLSVGFNREPIIHIMQLRGHSNGEVPRQVWATVRRWIDHHDLIAIEPKRIPWGEAPLDRAAWLDLWRPYWLAKRCIPDWLPLRPSRLAANSL